MLLYLFLGVKQKLHKRHDLFIVFASEKRSVSDLNYYTFRQFKFGNKIVSLVLHKADHATDYFPSREYCVGGILTSKSVG